MNRLAKHVSAHTGRPVAAVEPIAAGLGARRFARIVFASGMPATLVARCEPESPLVEGDARPRPLETGPRASVALPTAPAWLPEPPLEPLRSFLEEAGLPVPQSAGRFPELGLELLEDVGETSLLRAPADERDALYEAACALIPALQRLNAPAERIPAFGRRYDRALVETKAWKWLHWAIPGLLRRPPSEHETRETTRLFEAIAALLEDAPRRLAHRDYKAENLHLRRPPGGGPPRLVMIDVQGAFVAPPEYDLACLLYDLQVDLPEERAQGLLARTGPALPDAPDPATLHLRFDAIAVARLAKDVAHVVQAGLVRGDRRRWHEIPRGLALLERAARRLEGALPGIETLISVIRALTRAFESADIAGEGTAR